MVNVLGAYLLRDHQLIFQGAIYILVRQELNTHLED